MNQSKIASTMFALAITLTLPSAAFARPNAGAPEPGQVQTPASSNSIYGRWMQSASGSNGENMSITAYFTFAPDHISVRSECHVGGLFGTKMVAQLTVSANITPDGQFSNVYPPTDESQGRVAVRIGNTTYRCNANFNANPTGRLVVQGNTIFVYNENGQLARLPSGDPVTFTRVN